MRGEGVSRGCCRHRAKSGKKTMKGCKVWGNLGNISLIDVESEEVDNVIIIDVPNSLHHKFRGSSGIRKGERFSFPDIICIDDDDDDDECVSDELKAPEINVGGRSDLDSDGSSSSSSEHVQKAVSTDAGDPRVVQENGEEISLSKCKVAPLSNRYGLNTVPDIDASSSDSSDCEVIEGSSTELNEQWERACLKRKSNRSNAQYGRADWATSSSFNKVNHPDFNVHSRTKENAEPFCTSSESVKLEKVASSARTATEDGLVGGTVLSPQKENIFTKLNEKISQPSERNVILERSFSKVSSKNNMSRHSISNSKLRPNSGTVEGNECNTDTMACESNPLDDSPDDVIPTIQRNIINEREELKKTDEYKRVMEEEWAARQFQLKTQAEEAQRLRRKKKAEMLRILDMEKRQKRRLEEVRASQKKDEEDLNMKEIVRTEVRKELHRLEMTCVDMASLLRCLGIHVSGGFQPTPDEVRAAYKQALLKFHPDRASRTDLRQQVEAEEKFKLISRMKEKFFSISGY
ncbi:hypothetical protein K2173_016967 [Erythroxylum novogranatense]|uniref:J domain-containing protein n=1 Tax=Erythroxylum novogranatense TaxID=1862640 RepID=A0AAV8U5C9_9ROSI|nr:hypothetical protein K2173_016967 [Erythroxylum novogranatense]